MKRIAVLIAVLLLALTAFAGCSAAYNRSGEAYIEPSTDKSVSFDGAGDPASNPETGVLDPLGNRKVIRDAALSVETLEFDTFMSSVLAKTNALGGYVESNVTSNHAPYYSRTVLRGAKLVLRIPADKLDEFLTTVDNAGNVTSRSEKVSDITDTYIDTEARLRSLRTEYDTLLGLLEKAENLDEIIRLQDRLSNVRYEIESYEARIRSYDSLIAFSTVTMDVSEVERETAVEEESFGQEVSRRFKESLHDVGEGFRDFAAWFIGNLPLIVVVLLFFPGIPLVIAFIIVACVRRSKKKRAEKAAAEAKQN